MKGVHVIGSRTVKLCELPKPKPEYGQVLVKPKEVGICGSDLHPYRSDPRSDAKLLVPGHELTGVIEEVGPGVENVMEGDRVVAYQAWGCGYCEQCASGHANLCANRKIIGKADRYQKDYSVITEGMCLPLPSR